LKPGADIVNARPYNLSHFQKDTMEALILHLLKNQVIRPSVSSYSSPTILVKKKDGTWRLCIDYKKLKQLTVKNKFSIPVIEDLLDELQGTKLFSKIDLRSSYHQIIMDPRDIPKTTFSTHQGHFEYVVMPFGPTNAPTTFQTLMNQILQKYLRKFVLVFL
jgi:DNA-binding NtrC family response regulator